MKRVSRILVVHASLDRQQSVSRALSQRLLSRLLEQHPEARVIERDLAQSPPPHFGPAQVRAAFLTEDQRTLEDREALALSNELCRELMESDVVIIGVPMWNFSVPSALKAWVDHIVRAGVTFRYTPKGPEGLLSSNQRVFLMEATGGVYESEAASGSNHAAPWLEQVFRFLGVSAVQIVSAQGSALFDRGHLLEQGFQRISQVEVSPVSA